MVTKVRGAFTDFSGSMTLDGSQPGSSSATLTVQMASIDSGSPDRDAHLRSADFFDVETFPTMTFKTTAVKTKGDDEFIVVGDLTIKDVTRPIEIEVEADGVVTDPFGNTRAGFEGEAEISRKDYGLTWNVPLDTGGVLVSDKIKIQLDVSATKNA
jgi:polyisoprenoid-binding protein YceI